MQCSQAWTALQTLPHTKRLRGRTRGRGDGKGDGQGDPSRHIPAQATLSPPPALGQPCSLHRLSSVETLTPAGRQPQSLGKPGQGADRWQRRSGRCRSRWRTLPVQNPPPPHPPTPRPGRHDESHGALRTRSLTRSGNYTFPPSTANKGAGVAALSETHRRAPGTQSDGVEAILSQNQKRAVCMHPGSQGRPVVQELTSHTLGVTGCHACGTRLGKRTKGLCAKAAPAQAPSSARTKVPGVRPAQCRHPLAPPQKCHEREATLTLNIFKLF